MTTVAVSVTVAVWVSVRVATLVVSVAVTHGVVLVLPAAAMVARARRRDGARLRSR
jgi:hypothetical protein